MKVRNKRELQQIAFIHHSSLDINFEYLMNLYTKCTAKPFSVLVIDNALASGNPLRFRKDLLKRI